MMSKRRKRQAALVSVEQDDDSSDSTTSKGDMGSGVEGHTDEESPSKRRKVNSSSPAPLSASDWVVAAALVDDEVTNNNTTEQPAENSDNVSKTRQLEQEKEELLRELALERELRAKLVQTLYMRTRETLEEEHTYDYLQTQIDMLTRHVEKLQRENENHQKTIAKLQEELKQAQSATLTIEAQNELEKHKKALELAIVYQQQQTVMAMAAQQQARQWMLQLQAAAKAANINIPGITDNDAIAMMAAGAPNQAMPFPHMNPPHMNPMACAPYMPSMVATAVPPQQKVPVAPGPQPGSPSRKDA